MAIVEYLEEPVSVYDLTVDGVHCFFGGGILAHNCQEVDLPSKPLRDIHDTAGEIALCTLAAQNWAAYHSATDPKMRKDAFILVRLLDNILTYQDYPVEAARLATMNRRPLGVGITNFAFWMATHGFSYDDVSDLCLAKVDAWAAHWSKNLIDASIALAKERGACPLVGETKYSQGIVPCDTAKSDVAELVAATSTVDWETTRANLKATGIRNSTLMACMPCETSALVSNHTNGIEPIRAFVTKKKNKDQVVPVVAPGIYHPRWKKGYSLLWDIKSPRGYLKIAAVLQRYIDQGISVNTSYNQEHHSIEGGIPMSILLGDLLFFYKYGGKQLYYMNTNDGAGEIRFDATTTPAQQEPTGDAVCDSCAV
ncbi:MAG: Ribonucleoside-diphosphate reductase 1 subunit alpha [Dehalococcoidia bacterium]|nr:Ribonucleoside-diphosphate reductase 1 subunit alpha [Chloroflexota bacterium]